MAKSIEEIEADLAFLKNQIALLRTVEGQNSRPLGEITMGLTASADDLAEATNRVVKAFKGDAVTELSEETKTLLTILRHRTLVQKYLLKLARELEARALVHDLSKFKEDEFTGFVEINRIACEHPYGSPEYKASIKSDAVALHWANNSHHPEFHHRGIAAMDFIDIVEMVIDWKAASETYGQSTFDESLKAQEDRYKLSPEQLYIIKLLAKELEDLE